MALYIILIILAATTGLMIYGSVKAGQWHREHRGEETITESDHFYMGIFYYNPDDGRIFIRKRSGGGFTLNFANPLSILTALLIIALFVVLFILTDT